MTDEVQPLVYVICVDAKSAQYNQLCATITVSPAEKGLRGVVLLSAKPGVFVAGDVRRSSMKRVASAVGDGAMAVYLVHQYLEDV